MNQRNARVEVILRIPGNWQHPGELIERIPDGYRLTPTALILPDGNEIELSPMAPDNQFASIFRSSCRRPALESELQVVDNYTVNVCLSGPGASMEGARTMLQAGAAILRAGGGGVFVDNSAVAHGGTQWIEMQEDGGPDAVSFAFVGIVRGEQEVWTMGMHVPGLPDVVMRRSDLDADGSAIIDVIRYMCVSDHPIDDGHVLGDEVAARFKAEAIGTDDFAPNSPMHNPFGRLRLISLKDIAERN